MDFDGDLIHMNSLRYQVFKRSLVCAACGIEGSFMAKEQQTSATQPDRWHFNLYAVKDGVEVLMTKDHIHPKSKGGKDTLDNFQTMCMPCNKAKGNSLESYHEQHHRFHQEQQADRGDRLGNAAPEFQRQDADHRRHGRLPAHWRGAPGEGDQYQSDCYGEAVKVRELIERLQACDPSKEVLVRGIGEDPDTDIARLATGTVMHPLDDEERLYVYLIPSVRGRQ